jgi:predicted amidohydrolase
MKVTVLQTDIKWAQPVANIDNVELLIASAHKSDLNVLKL